MDDEFYLPLLTAIILGFGIVLCLLKYWIKKDYLEETRRSNELETILIIYALKEQLADNDNMDIYNQLSTIEQTYIFPDLDEAHNLKEEERIQKEKEKLDNYLSVLETCSLLIQTGSITHSQVHIILGDRLEDIKSHKQLYDYICSAPHYYKDLIWLMKKM